MSQLHIEYNDNVYYWVNEKKEDGKTYTVYRDPNNPQSDIIIEEDGKDVKILEMSEELTKTKEGWQDKSKLKIKLEDKETHKKANKIKKKTKEEAKTKEKEKKVEVCFTKKQKDNYEKEIKKLEDEIEKLKKEKKVKGGKK